MNDRNKEKTTTWCKLIPNDWTFSFKSSETGGAEKQFSGLSVRTFDLVAKFCSKAGVTIRIRISWKRGQKNLDDLYFFWKKLETKKEPC